MSPRLAFAIDAAVQAGRLTLAHFQTGVGFDLKSDATPVTVADKGAERLLRELIGHSYGLEQVLGEEEGGDHETPNRWVLDPIDGTKSFVSGVPLYATLVSFEQDYEPIVGVAYFPALDELLYAEKGGGAFFNGRPARVSQRDKIAGSVVCCGGLRSMIDNRKWDGFAKISAIAMATRTWSDAYGHALVSTGRVDAMADPIVSRWDLSAVKLIAEEAGGRFTDFKGGPALNQNSKLEALHSNGLIHEELMEAFRG